MARSRRYTVRFEVVLRYSRNLLRNADLALDYVLYERDILYTPYLHSTIWLSLKEKLLGKLTCIFGGSVPCALRLGPDAPGWNPRGMSLA